MSAVPLWQRDKGCMKFLKYSWNKLRRKNVGKTWKELEMSKIIERYFARCVSYKMFHVMCVDTLIYDRIDGACVHTIKALDNDASFELAVRRGAAHAVAKGIDASEHVAASRCLVQEGQEDHWHAHHIQKLAEMARMQQLKVTEGNG